MGGIDGCILLLNVLLTVLEGDHDNKRVISFRYILLLTIKFKF